MEEFDANKKIQEDVTIVGTLTNLDRKNLGLTAFWTRLIGIITYITVGIIVASLLLSIWYSVQSSNSGNGIFIVLGILVSIGVALLIYMIGRYHFKAGTYLKAAMEYNLDIDFSDGIRNLKSIFRIQGILILILSGFSYKKTS
jgi:hypothetical protein